jgi:predicted alpha/beta hydrolase family esterase
LYATTNDYFVFAVSLFHKYAGKILFIQIIFTRFKNFILTYLSIMNTKVFILPGLYNSGPQHWQTHWENEYGFIRINQKEWDRPVCEDWLTTVEKTLAGEVYENIILLGHSTACVTIVKWAEKYGHIIKGALLVAPSDTESENYPEDPTGFIPMPSFRLPFPSIIITTTKDEVVSVSRAKQFAENWGSELVLLEEGRHLGGDANLGLWPFGFQQLQKLMN